MAVDVVEKEWMGFLRATVRKGVTQYWTIVEIVILPGALTALVLSGSAMFSLAIAGAGLAAMWLPLLGVAMIQARNERKAWMPRTTEVQGDNIRITCPAFSASVALADCRIAEGTTFDDYLGEHLTAAKVVAVKAPILNAGEIILTLPVAAGGRGDAARMLSAAETTSFALNPTRCGPIRRPAHDWSVVAAVNLAPIVSGLVAELLVWISDLHEFYIDIFSCSFVSVLASISVFDTRRARRETRENASFLVAMMVLWTVAGCFAQMWRHQAPPNLFDCLITYGSASIPVALLLILCRIQLLARKEKAAS